MAACDIPEEAAEHNDVGLSKRKQKRQQKQLLRLAPSEPAGSSFVSDAASSTPSVLAASASSSSPGQDVLVPTNQNRKSVQEGSAVSHVDAREW